LGKITKWRRWRGTLGRETEKKDNPEMKRANNVRKQGVATTWGKGKTRVKTKRGGSLSKKKN